VKLQGRFFKPFLVRFPLFPIKKGIVSDDEIRAKSDGYQAESAVVRAGKEINRLIRTVEGLVNKEEKEVVLIEEERNFLIDIAKNPISGVVARYQRLGINRYQGNKIQASLIEKGLISWRPVSTKKGRIKVLVLTDRGKKVIPDVKIEKIFHKAGSWEHEYWKFRVGEYYRKRGYKVTFECKIGEGKSVDLVAEKDGKRIALEIETGKSDTIYNIRKDLEAGFDDVVVVAIGRNIERKIREEISFSSFSKHVRVLNEFSVLHQNSIISDYRNSV
jgi:DNA-binding MarR family transcriptional regulator